MESTTVYQRIHQLCMIKQVLLETDKRVFPQFYHDMGFENFYPRPAGYDRQALQAFQYDIEAEMMLREYVRQENIEKSTKRDRELQENDFGEYVYDLLESDRKTEQLFYLLHVFDEEMLAFFRKEMPAKMAELEKAAADIGSTSI